MVALTYSVALLAYALLPLYIVAMQICYRTDLAMVFVLGSNTRPTDLPPEDPLFLAQDCNIKLCQTSQPLNALNTMYSIDQDNSILRHMA